MMGCISTLLASRKPAAVLTSRPHGLCSSLHEIGATKVHNMAASKWVVLVSSSIAVPVNAYKSEFLNALLLSINAFSLTLLLNTLSKSSIFACEEDISYQSVVTKAIVSHHALPR